MITDHTTATKKRSAAPISTGRDPAMTNVDAFAVLCQHAISHLPDSVAGRQAVLTALILRAPRNSPLAQQVREMQWHLEAHLRLSKTAPADAAQPTLTTHPGQ
jgi:hypothetical protein